jgi:ribosomal protein S18 acetylase RimI-like enzyme
LSQSEPAPEDSIEIREAQPPDYPVIGNLARTIWRACFQGIISAEQIEYMLAQRYTPQAIAEAVTSGRLTYLLLTVRGESRAFAAHGSGERPEELKLHQLYVHPQWQGTGLGSRLMTHVEDIARAHGRTFVVLTVNRANTRALNAYLHRGFNIRGEVVVDIGGGFVMDDYVMEKRLNP